MDWEEISVIELETERTHCDCCRQITTHAAGELFLENEPIGWFSVNFSNNLTSHPPVIKVYVGDWSDEAPSDARWGVSISWHSEGCTILDWDDGDLANNDLFTRLNRNDVLGSGFAKELWAMVDAVVMKDNRLKELHPS